ncbi:carbohydrate ABC transporter permease, partial [Myceligenerans salitolerans]|nr:carbohydrate ABC transporter permease [Myceligenerans salitolerans]
MTTLLEPVSRKTPAQRAATAPGRYAVARTARYTAMLLFVLLVLIPVYVLFVTSFKGAGDAA